MTRIKMLRTMPVAPDGIFTEIWRAGSVRDVKDDLLAILIDAGAIEIVENKAIMAAPENKAKRGRPRKNAVQS